MIDSPKNTQLKRRKRAAELIGLFSQVFFSLLIALESNRRGHIRKHEEDDSHLSPRSEHYF